ncbi:hypothetical protein ABPG73_008397 [Tetrahymena malaccensis]
MELIIKIQRVIIFFLIIAQILKYSYADVDLVCYQLSAYLNCAYTNTLINARSNFTDSEINNIQQYFQGNQCLSKTALYGSTLLSGNCNTNTQISINYSSPQVIYQIYFVIAYNIDYHSYDFSSNKVQVEINSKTYYSPILYYQNSFHSTWYNYFLRYEVVNSNQITIKITPTDSNFSQAQAYISEIGLFVQMKCPYNCASCDSLSVCSQFLKYSHADTWIFPANGCQSLNCNFSQYMINSRSNFIQREIDTLKLFTENQCLGLIQYNTQTFLQGCFQSNNEIQIYYESIQVISLITFYIDFLIPQVIDTSLKVKVDINSNIQYSQNGYTTQSNTYSSISYMDIKGYILNSKQLTIKVTPTYQSQSSYTTYITGIFLSVQWLQIIFSQTLNLQHLISSCPHRLQKYGQYQFSLSYNNSQGLSIKQIKNQVQKYSYAGEWFNNLANGCQGLNCDYTTNVINSKWDFQQTEVDNMKQYFSYSNCLQLANFNNLKPIKGCFLSNKDIQLLYEPPKNQIIFQINFRIGLVVLSQIDTNLKIKVQINKSTDFSQKNYTQYTEPSYSSNEYVNYQFTVNTNKLVIKVTPTNPIDQNQSSSITYISGIYLAVQLCQQYCSNCDYQQVMYIQPIKRYNHDFKLFTANFKSQTFATCRVYKSMILRRYNKNCLIGSSFGNRIGNPIIQQYLIDKKLQKNLKTQKKNGIINQIKQDYKISLVLKYSYASTWISPKNGCQSLNCDLKQYLINSIWSLEQSEVDIMKSYFPESKKCLQLVKINTLTAMQGCFQSNNEILIYYESPQVISLVSFYIGFAIPEVIDTSLKLKIDINSKTQYSQTNYATNQKNISTISFMEIQGYTLNSNKLTIKVIPTYQAQKSYTTYITGVFLGIQLILLLEKDK